MATKPKVKFLRTAHKGPMGQDLEVWRSRNLSAADREECK